MHQRPERAVWKNLTLSSRETERRQERAVPRDAAHLGGLTPRNARHPPEPSSPLRSPSIPEVGPGTETREGARLSASVSRTAQIRAGVPTPFGESGYFEPRWLLAALSTAPPTRRGGDTKRETDAGSLSAEEKCTRSAQLRRKTQRTPGSETRRTDASRSHAEQAEFPRRRSSKRPRSFPS